MLPRRIRLRDRGKGPSLTLPQSEGVSVLSLKFLSVELLNHKHDVDDFQ